MHARSRLLLPLLLGTAGLPARASATVLPPDLRRAVWTADSGQTVRLQDLGAPWIVLTMAYTACRRTCNATSVVLTEIQRELDAAGEAARFIVVSYDPANDSPDQWREYRDKRGLKRSNWVFLSGAENDTRKLARMLDLDFWTYHDHIVHDFRILFFDAQWRQRFELRWEQVDQVAELIRAARP
jgi:cytochrome oxidase Cu insertion factor (SCO1/SenC/PrrC family)